jgi:hypothetical protein
LNILYPNSGKSVHRVTFLSPAFRAYPDNHTTSCPQTAAMPQGQQIGGEEGCDFLHAWREKAQGQVYLAPIREPSIVAALKKEYQDFYKSIGFSRTAEQAKDAFGSAHPSKKSKQAVSFLLFILLWFLFNLTFVFRNATKSVRAI